MGVMRHHGFLIAVVGAMVWAAGCNTAEMEDSYTKAVLQGDAGLARRLASEGVMVSKAGEGSPSEFAMAVSGGEYEVAEVLLGAGGNVNETIDGVSLIELMKSEENEEAVAWLEKRGARIKP